MNQQNYGGPFDIGSRILEVSCSHCVAPSHIETRLDSFPPNAGSMQLIEMPAWTLPPEVGQGSLANEPSVLFGESEAGGSHVTIGSVHSAPNRRGSET